MSFDAIHGKAVVLAEQLAAMSPQDLAYLPQTADLAQLLGEMRGLAATAGQRSAVDELETQLRQLRLSSAADSLPGHYGDDPLENVLLQQQLQQQDELVQGQLARSIAALHEQALQINSELEDQQGLLARVEDGMDALNSKLLGRGMRQMEHLLAHNEWAGNCCIVLLIVVLAIVLVLLIIA